MNNVIDEKKNITQKIVNKRYSISQPSYKELIFFKEDIYQHLKELEKKIQEKTNLSLLNFNNRILKGENNIKQFENLLNQYINKSDFEEKKIEIKNEFNKKIETYTDEISSINIQISALQKELTDSCYKYDKIILDNLKINGLIGEGCKFRNLKEYIIQQREEIIKIEKINQSTLFELKLFKNKIENIIKEFNVQIETLKGSFGEYINIQIENYDQQQRKIINEINDKIAKNFIHVEEIKNEINNVKNLVKDVKEIKKEIVDIKNNIIKQMENTIEKTKKMDLTVLNEFNEIKKDFKNIKVNIIAIGDLINENNNNNNEDNNEENNNFKNEILRNEIINNFNNTIINLMKDLKSEKMKFVSKKSIKNIIKKDNVNKTNKNLKKMKSMINQSPKLNHRVRRASEINMIFPFDNHNEKKEKDSTSIKKSFGSHLDSGNPNSNNNNEISNNNFIGINILKNHKLNFSNNLLRKSFEISFTDNNKVDINKKEQNKNTSLDSSFSSEREEKNSPKIDNKKKEDNINIGIKKEDKKNVEIKKEDNKKIEIKKMNNKNIEKEDDKNIEIKKEDNKDNEIIKIDIQKNLKENIFNANDSSSLMDNRNSDNIKEKKTKKIIIEPKSFSANKKLNKNISFTTNNNSIENSEINKKKNEKKIIFRNKLENKKEQPLKVLKINEQPSPHNSFTNINNKNLHLNSSTSNFMNYQNLNLIKEKDKEKENFYTLYKNKTQRISSSKKNKNKLPSNIYIIPDSEIIDIPLIQNENLKIDKTKTQLEKKIIELEFFTKKKFDELVKEIKNFIPIHFNSYIKDYKILESDDKNFKNNFSYSQNYFTQNKKKTNASTSYENTYSNSQINLKTSINFHKKNNTFL